MAVGKGSIARAGSANAAARKKPIEKTAGEAAAAKAAEPAAKEEGAQKHYEVVSSITCSLPIHLL